MHACVRQISDGGEESADVRHAAILHACLLTLSHISLTFWMQILQAEGAAAANVVTIRIWHSFFTLQSKVGQARIVLLTT